MASPPPEEVQYQLDHRHENESRSLAAFYLVCMIVAFTCMVSRIVSRLLMGTGLKADDWTLLVGVTIAEGSFIVLMIYGLGQHWLTLTSDQQRLFPKLNYAYNILNVTCYPIIKIAILLLYIRIFITRTFRRIVWACIAFVASIGISTGLVAIFACTPVQGFYDPSVPARCIDSNSFYWAQASLNVITDAIILVLPLPSIWRLQTTTRRKIGISLLLMLGGLTFVVSIIRIVYYLRFNPYDPSYSFIPTGYSTPAEVTLAIICACAPTWRPLSSRVVASIRSRISSLRSSRTYYDVGPKGGPDHSDGSATSLGKHHHLVQPGRDVELPPMPQVHRGTNHGIYEAKQNGLPETQTGARGSSSRSESHDGGGTTPELPIEGIRIKREVAVESGYSS